MPIIYFYVFDLKNFKTLNSKKILQEQLDLKRQLRNDIKIFFNLITYLCFYDHTYKFLRFVLIAKFNSFCITFTLSTMDGPCFCPRIYLIKYLHISNSLEVLLLFFFSAKQTALNLKSALKTIFRPYRLI